MSLLIALTCGSVPLSEGQPSSLRAYVYKTEWSGWMSRSRNAQSTERAQRRATSRGFSRAVERQVLGGGDLVEVLGGVLGGAIRCQSHGFGQIKTTDKIIREQGRMNMVFDHRKSKTNKDVFQNEARQPSSNA